MVYRDAETGEYEHIPVEPARFVPFVRGVVRKNIE
jgi:hypothetical protein